MHQCPHVLFGHSIIVDRGGCPEEYAPGESDVSLAAFVPVGSRETSSCVQVQTPELEVIVTATAIQASFCGVSRHPEKPNCQGQQINELWANGGESPTRRFRLVHIVKHRASQQCMSWLTPSLGFLIAGFQSTRR